MSFPGDETWQNHPTHIASSSPRGALSSKPSWLSRNTINNGNMTNDDPIPRPNFYDLTSTSYEDDSLGNESNNPRTSRNCSVMDDGSNFRAGTKESPTGMPTKLAKSSRENREKFMSTNNESILINLLDDGPGFPIGDDEMKRKRPLENGILSCHTAKNIPQKNYTRFDQKRPKDLQETRKLETGGLESSTDLKKRASWRSSAAAFNVNSMQNSIHDESLPSVKSHHPCRQSPYATATPLPKRSTLCSDHLSSKPYNPYIKSTNPTATFTRKPSRSNTITTVTDGSNNVVSSQYNISSSIQQQTMDGATITFGLLALIEELRDENTFTCNRNALPAENTVNQMLSCPQRQLQHFSQNDNWSCGFRNLQMMLCSLIPKFQDIFPSGIPSLIELQTSLELLWTEGFDQDGAKHH